MDASYVPHAFDDGSCLHALRVVERSLGDTRVQLLPAAEMCTAAYCHSWLAGEPAVGTDDDADVRRDRRKWQLQIRLLNEFWLAKQTAAFAEMEEATHGSLQRLEDVVGHDGAFLDDAVRLRSYLTAYLHLRGLPADAAPRLLLQHRMLFAEYFSPHAWQLGQNGDFDRTLHVVLHTGAAVGQVLLGGCGQDRGAGADRPTPMMQGILACPFYTSHLHRQRSEAQAAGGGASTRTLGVGDSILLHLWEARHGPAPPFLTLRVHPIRNAVSWRKRLTELSFVRDWQGGLFEEQRDQGLVSSDEDDDEDENSDAGGHGEGDGHGGGG